jgi:hypothetical protein
MAAAAIMGGASLAAGVGTTLFARNQSQKAQDQAMRATSGAPSYGRTMLEALKAQGKIAGRQFELESQFQPKYADLQSQVQGQLGQAGMQQAGQLYNQAADIENQYLGRVRMGDIDQLNRLLPQYKKAFEALYPGSAAASEATGQLAAQSMQSALQRPQLTAFEAGIAGPQLESGLGTIDQGLVGQYMGAQPGVSGIAGQLAQQAQADLAAGRSLTPEEERMSQQAARQAFAARGMAMGPQSMAAEILNQNQLANQRYQQRQQAGQQIAGTISNLYQPALQQAFQRQAGAEQFNLGAQGQAFQQALQRGQAQLGRLQGETAVQAGRAQLGSMAMQQLQQQQQPLLNAFYRNPLLANLPGQQQQMALQSQAAMGPGLFNPESQMAFQSAFMPYQARQAAALGGVQQTAANNAGMMGMVGSGMEMAGQFGSAYMRNQALNTPPKTGIQPIR